MHQLGDATFAELIAAVADAVAALTAADTSLLSDQDLRTVWAQSVRAARILEGASNVSLAQLLDSHGFDDIMGPYTEVVGALVNCGDGEAAARIKAARTLAPRTLPSGERADAKYPATAEAVRDGVITSAHVAVVHDFDKELSDDVPPDVREAAERQLGNLARHTRPREFRRAAEALAQMIDQDGKPPRDGEEPKRPTYITFDRQGKDGMSDGRMRVDAEMRALMESVCAKGGKPGNAVGDDSDAAPSERWDSRSAGERNHDAVRAALTGYLASGALGKHRGVPCVPIVTMTLDQLESASGLALTASGTRLDVRDAIRMASGQHAFCCFSTNTNGHCSWVERNVLQRRINGSPCTRPSADAVFPDARRRGCGVRCTTRRNGWSTTDSPTSIHSPWRASVTIDWSVPATINGQPRSRVTTMPTRAARCGIHRRPSIRTGPAG
jgi:hypothetical protein